MTNQNRLVLILGDQLDLNGAALRAFNFTIDSVIMIESASEATQVWSHKVKIALFLSAMRHFAQALESRHYALTYVRQSSLSIVEALRVELLRKKITRLVCVEPGEWRLRP